MLSKNINRILWELEILQLLLFKFALLHVDYLCQEVMIAHRLVVDDVSNLLLHGLIDLNFLLAHGILKLLIRDQLRSTSVILNHEEARICKVLFMRFLMDTCLLEFHVTNQLLALFLLLF